jgi:metal-responsive CopG/Arc/MetJ family transcriptional regulator
MMKRVNITIDEGLYHTLRSISFLQEKSISEVIRDKLNESLKKDKKLKKTASLILEADDEKEILKILKENDYMDWKEVKKKHGLK